MELAKRKKNMSYRRYRRALYKLYQTPTFIFPEFYEQVFKTTGRFSWTVPSTETTFAASLSALTIRFTNPSDPFGTTRQPYAWDLIKTMYGDYRVISARAEIRTRSTASTTSPFVQDIMLAIQTICTGLTATTYPLAINDAIDNPTVRTMLIPAPNTAENRPSGIDGMKKWESRVWVPNWFRKVPSAGEFTDYWTDTSTGPTSYNVDLQIYPAIYATPTTPAQTVLVNDVILYQRVQFRNPSRDEYDQ